MSILIDTHCHLDLFKDIQFNKQSEDSQGIKTITVTNAPSFYKPNVKLFDGSTNIRVALGLHPQLVSQYKDELNLFELLIKNVRYVGEIGLDGSSELKNTYTTQKRLLEQILGVCSTYDNKILTIHSRNAASEVIEMLVRCLGKSNCKIILHWYSGGLPELKAAIQKGFYFSINHKMVSSNKGKEIIKTIPEHLLLTETDAPFTFSNGIKTRIESLNSTIIGLGFQKGKSPDEIRDMVYNNFKKIL